MVRTNGFEISHEIGIAGMLMPRVGRRRFAGLRPFSEDAQVQADLSHVPSGASDMLTLELFVHPPKAHPRERHPVVKDDGSQGSKILLRPCAVEHGTPRNFQDAADRA